jgi:glucose/mannose-6-phosphate isomerase
LISIDNTAQYPEVDTQNMLGHIEDLPAQLTAAWRVGIDHSINGLTPPRNIVIAGVGGSAIGADLLSSYVQGTCPVPVLIQRDYGLPAWANGPGTLVIASSHSGNTEETVSAYGEAISRGCQTVAISRGGKLAEAARQHDVPWWSFTHNGQPRSAVGWTFGLLLALFHQLGLAADASHELQAASEAMLEQQEYLAPQVPLIKNPAKRQAGQLMDRWVCVAGSDIFAPVARRWKGQMNELPKAWAQFEFLPELDHNTLAGTIVPAEMLEKLVVLFIRGGTENVRNGLRSELSRQEFMQQGIATDVYQAKGTTAMEQMWTAIHFGDYMTYYLALLYGIDPTPIVAMENLKVRLKQH